MSTSTSNRLSGSPSRLRCCQGTVDPALLLMVVMPGLSSVTHVQTCTPRTCGIRVATCCEPQTTHVLALHHLLPSFWCHHFTDFPEHLQLPAKCAVARGDGPQQRVPIAMMHCQSIICRRKDWAKGAHAAGRFPRGIVVKKAHGGERLARACCYCQCSNSEHSAAL
jgi:hypothetical protein